jgi:hypothetical protein
LLEYPSVALRDGSGPRYVADGDLKALRLEGFRLLEGLRDRLGDRRADLGPALDLVELDP